MFALDQLEAYNARAARCFRPGIQPRFFARFEQLANTTPPGPPH
jgi:hypothetical protein